MIHEVSITAVQRTCPLSCANAVRAVSLGNILTFVLEPSLRCGVVKFHTMLNDQKSSHFGQSLLTQNTHPPLGQARQRSEIDEEQRIFTKAKDLS